MFRSCDLSPLISGSKGATNPHEYYAFSTGAVFEGVISGDGKWKLHLPHKFRQLVTAGNDGAAGQAMFLVAETGADVGAIVPGRYADMVAVKADPLADIRVLEKIDHVMKGGALER